MSSKMSQSWASAFTWHHVQVSPFYHKTAFLVHFLSWECSPCKNFDHHGSQDWESVSRGEPTQENSQQVSTTAVEWASPNTHGPSGSRSTQFMVTLSESMEYWMLVWLDLWQWLPLLLLFLWEIRTIIYQAECDGNPISSVSSKLRQVDYMFGAILSYIMKPYLK